MNHSGKIVAWSCWFCLFLTIPDAFAQITISAVVGFDGKVNIGAIHPITVTVRNDGQAAEGTISLATDGITYSVPFSCAEKATAVRQLFFFPTASGHTLRINASIPKQKIHVLLEATPTFVDRPFILLCKEDDLRIDHRPSSPLSDLTTAAIDAAHFPEQWSGLSAVDTVILGENGAGRMNERQLAALVKWVYNGGKLFLLCGRKSDLYRNTPIWGALPATIAGHATIDTYDAIASAARESVEYKEKMAISAIEKNETCEILLKEGDVPLAIAGPSGHGSVAMALFDFDAEPVKSLRQRWRLLANLAAKIPSLFLTALDESRTFFAAMKPSREEHVPVSTLLILLVAYLAVIGPLDYLILRLLNKLEWTWLTFAATSAITTVVVVYCIYDYKKGMLLFDKLTVAEISPDRKGTRLSTSAHLYSQSNAYYNFSTAADGALNIAQAMRRTSFAEKSIALTFGETVNLSGYYVPIWTGAGFSESNVDLGCKIRIGRAGRGFDVANDYPFDIAEGIILDKDGWAYRMESTPALGRGEQRNLSPIDDDADVPISSVPDKRWRLALANILSDIHSRRGGRERATAICWAKRSLSPMSLTNASASISELTVFIVPVEEEQ